LDHRNPNRSDSILPGSDPDCKAIILLLSATIHADGVHVLAISFERGQPFVAIAANEQPEVIRDIHTYMAAPLHRQFSDDTLAVVIVIHFLFFRGTLLQFRGNSDCHFYRRLEQSIHGRVVQMPDGAADPLPLYLYQYLPVHIWALK